MVNTKVEILSFASHAFVTAKWRFTRLIRHFRILNRHFARLKRGLGDCFIIPLNYTAKVRNSETS